MKIWKDAEGFATCCAQLAIACTCRKKVNTSREMQCMVNTLAALMYFVAR